jgi:ergothioneine biosynthesis protein EgtB
MPDCSPAKWHRAHTCWFFETFILSAEPGYRPFDPTFGYLFNSYYEAVGPRHPRPQRGLLSRPSCAEIERYRAHIDGAMERSLEAGVALETEALIELGLNHEQQHQELLLTDIKHAFWLNPTRPAYMPRSAPEPSNVPPQGWATLPAGLYEIGAEEAGFAFDNEGPRHRTYLPGSRVATRPVTNGEYLRFIEVGGYELPEFWLSDGWATVQAEGWRAPLYWIREADGWSVFTLHGMRPVDPAEPVQHVSFYEAAAYATWAGKRLPTEAEWEAALSPLAPLFADGGSVHPVPVETAISIGQVWDWTASAYAPYPGYKPPAGAVGEYNGKFMSGQMVLRGQSWATPAGHGRPTYRNFFPPAARRNSWTPFWRALHSRKNPSHANSSTMPRAHGCSRRFARRRNITRPGSSA